MRELTIESIAHGGEGVGRIDGKAHFVAGTVPGERVTVEIAKEKARWARGRLVEVLDPSPDRVNPPCPAYPTCGGCTWQHAAYERQLEWKRDVVAGQLAHLGGVRTAEVRPTIAPGPPFGYRNRMDFSVVDGRPALHVAHSDRLVPLETCLLLHPRLAGLLASLEGLSGVRKLTLRAGIATGDALIVVEGTLPHRADRWQASVVHRARGGPRTVRGRPWLEEEVAGIRFRIPANAFFQVNTPGAEELVRLVSAAAGAGEHDVLLDGYAGVGLFAATVGRTAGRVVTIDTGRAAYQAVARNLERAVAGRHRSLLGPFEQVARSLHEPWDVAVVDPPRAGLGRAGVDAVVGPRPHTIVLISCDPAALARDADLLGRAGYVLEWAQPVDLFPQTYHIEVVSRFVRT
jgi:23S rRNA (uracil1939-C5)-methyltransferase